MHVSPTAALRRLDLVVTGELMLVLATLVLQAPAWWPAAIAAGAAAAWLALRRRGSALSAYGLTTLLAVALLALAFVFSQRPVVLLLCSLALMQLALYQRWVLALLHGAVYAVVPHLVGVQGATVGLMGLSAYMLAQGGLVAWIARERMANGQALFDVEYLVRAMGSSGRIRLDLGVVRAETATGQRLKDVQDRVAGTLQQVRQSAQSASAAATTLLDAGQGLTDRTQAAGRELGDAAMTLEQIAVIVKDSADAAMAARQTAQAATALAQDVGGIVSQMEGQMQAIDTGARRITDIIGVIDGIAFQTNLLALNAAVEAARAGDQGRGFAVVATEVRMLAQRVTQAAGEVKGLIEESVQATARGNTLAREAGSTMGRLIESVTRVDSTFHSLSADTNEHAAGLVAMRDTMFAMKGATEQNLVLAEQAQTIAAELAGHAAGLDDVLSAFRLPGDGAMAPAAKAPSAAPQAVPKGEPPPSRPTAATATPAPPAEQAVAEFF